MQMKSIARRAFRYAGALVQPHAEFSVKSAAHVKVLTAARRAALLVAPPPVVAEAPAAPPKRAYKRRDMVAEPAVTVVADFAWPLTSEEPEPADMLPQAGDRDE